MNSSSKKDDGTSPKETDKEAIYHGTLNKNSNQERTNTTETEKSDSITDNSIDVENTVITMEMAFQYLPNLSNSENLLSIQSRSPQTLTDASNHHNTPNISPVISGPSTAEKKKFVDDLGSAINFLDKRHRSPMNPLENTGESDLVDGADSCVVENTLKMSGTLEYELGNLGEAETLPVDKLNISCRNGDPAWSDGSDQSDSIMCNKSHKVLIPCRSNTEESSSESDSFGERTNLLLLAKAAQMAKRKHLRSETYSKGPIIIEQSQRNSEKLSEPLASEVACNSLQSEDPEFGSISDKNQERNSSLTESAAKRRLFQNEIDHIIDVFSDVTLEDMKPIVYTDESQNESNEDMSPNEAEAYANARLESFVSKMHNGSDLNRPNTKAKPEHESKLKRSLSAENIGNLTKRSKNNFYCEKESDPINNSQPARRRKRQMSALSLSTRHEISSSPETKKKKHGSKKVRESISATESD